MMLFASVNKTPLKRVVPTAARPPTLPVPAATRTPVLPVPSEEEAGGSTSPLPGHIKNLNLQDNKVRQVEERREKNSDLSAS